jgi:hypothetical protein
VLRLRAVTLRRKRSPQTRADRASRLERLQHALRRVTAKLDDIVDVLGAIEDDVAQLRQSDAAPPDAGAQRRSRPSARDVAEAAAGVASLEITPNPDGSVSASINGRAAVRLRSQLGALLDVLATPGRCPEDGLVLWRSKTEIVSALRVRTQGNEQEADVAKVVHALRESLEAQGENKLLVQTHRRRGFRFALRTQGKGSVIGDEG